MFFDHGGIKLETSDRNMSGKYLNIWKLTQS